MQSQAELRLMGERVSRNVLMAKRQTQVMPNVEPVKEEKQTTTNVVSNRELELRNTISVLEKSIKDINAQLDILGEQYSKLDSSGYNPKERRFQQRLLGNQIRALKSDRDNIEDKYRKQVQKLGEYYPQKQTKTDVSYLAPSSPMGSTVKVAVEEPKTWGEIINKNLKYDTKTGQTYYLGVVTPQRTQADYTIMMAQGKPVKPIDTEILQPSKKLLIQAQYERGEITSQQLALELARLKREGKLEESSKTKESPSYFEVTKKTEITPFYAPKTEKLPSETITVTPKTGFIFDIPQTKMISGTFAPLEKDAFKGKKDISKVLMPELFRLAGSPEYFARRSLEAENEPFLKRIQTEGQLALASLMPSLSFINYEKRQAGESLIQSFQLPPIIYEAPIGIVSTSLQPVKTIRSIQEQPSEKTIGSITATAPIYAGAIELELGALIKAGQLAKKGIESYKYAQAQKSFLKQQQGESIAGIPINKILFPKLDTSPVQESTFQLSPYTFLKKEAVFNPATQLTKPSLVNFEATQLDIYGKQFMTTSEVESLRLKALGKSESNIVKTINPTTGDKITIITRPQGTIKETQSMLGTDKTFKTTTYQEAEKLNIPEGKEIILGDYYKNIKFESVPLIEIETIEGKPTAKLYNMWQISKEPILLSKFDEKPVTESISESTKKSGLSDYETQQLKEKSEKYLQSKELNFGVSGTSEESKFASLGFKKLSESGEVIRGTKGEVLSSVLIKNKPVTIIEQELQIPSSTSMEELSFGRTTYSPVKIGISTILSNQKVINVFGTKTVTGTTPITLIKQSKAEIQKPEQIIKPKQDMIYRIDTKEIQQSETKLIPKQETKQDITQKQNIFQDVNIKTEQQTLSQNKIEQIITPITKTIQRVYTKSKTELKTTLVPIPPKPKEEKKKKSKYKTLVRRKGIFEVVGTSETPEKAFEIGARKVSETARASFKVIEETGKPIKPSLFGFGERFRASKKEPEVIVQKARYRISSIGEKQEISAKGRMVQRLNKGRGVFG